MLPLVRAWDQCLSSWRPFRMTEINEERSPVKETYSIPLSPKKNPKPLHVLAYKKWSAHILFRKVSHPWRVEINKCDGSLGNSQSGVQALEHMAHLNGLVRSKLFCDSIGPSTHNEAAHLRRQDCWIGLGLQFYYIWCNKLELYLILIRLCSSISFVANILPKFLLNILIGW